MRSTLTLIALLLAAALPALALASEVPSRSEKQELRAAVKSSKLVERSVRKGNFRLLKPRIADNGRWAKSGIVPTRTYSDPFNAPKGLFKQTAKGWKLVKYGTSGVGCKKPRLSRSVRQDLKLRCG